MVKRHIPCTSLFLPFGPSLAKDQARTFPGSWLEPAQSEIVDVKISWRSANRLTLRTGKSILMIKRFI
jgi:hypothetical protein